MASTTKPPQAKYSEQNILNNSYDTDYDQLATEGLGFDGQGLQRNLGDSLATKITVSGTTTYVGKAAPGTAQSSALWQAMKIDESSGTVITWADGDSDFDNVATDLTALTYS